MSSRNVRKMGVELTFLPTSIESEPEKDRFGRIINYHVGIREAEDQRDKTVDLIREKLTERKVKVYRVGSDPHVVEIPTVPYAFGSTETLMKNIEQIYATCADCGMGKVEDWYSTGGGGHIHITDTSMLTKRAILIFFMKYWSVPWAFAAPTNRTDGHAHIFNRYAKFGHNKVESILEYLKRVMNNDDPEIPSWSGQYIRSNAPRWTDTIEFRFFRAARTMQEQRDHIDLIKAIVSYCQKNYDVLECWANRTNMKEYCTKNTTSKMEKRSAGQMVANYVQACRELGLDDERFRPYRQNVIDRRRFHHEQKYTRNAPSI